MGILNKSYGEGMDKMPAGCKRDYEREIQNCREKLSKASELKHALFDYCGDYAPDPISGMIGELVMEERRLQYQITQLIAEQEKSQ